MKKKDIVILKFGGTSVSSAKTIKTICAIVLKEKKQNRSPIVVVSALAKVTDLLLESITASSAQRKENLEKIQVLQKNLIEAVLDRKDALEVLAYIDTVLEKARKLLSKKHFSPPSKDTLLSLGEMMSSSFISRALQNHDVPSLPVLATECIVTNNHFGRADFLPEETTKYTKKSLLPLLAKDIVPVVTGFIGATKNGKTTTLGRGGSDYSASIIGFCLRASEIQIWTDVDGIFTADPRIVKTASLIPSISYREGSELASFGAKVLHPRTLIPAIFANIPVRVLNSFHPEGTGTIVSEKPEIKNPITAVSYKRSITLVNIYSIESLDQKGFLAKVFKIFAKNNISTDLISSSLVSDSIVLDNYEQLQKATNEISKFARVTIKKDFGIVSLIGEGVVTATSTIRRIFEVLDEKKILVKMVSLGGIDINVSLVVKSEEVEGAVIALHKAFLE